MPDGAQHFNIFHEGTLVTSNEARPTRADRAEAARLGVHPSEIVQARVKEAKLRERRPRGPRREIPEAQYASLVEIATLAATFMPMLEEAGAFHREPRAFIKLREALADLSAHDPKIFGQDAAVGELLTILQATDG